MKTKMLSNQNKGWITPSAERLVSIYEKKLDTHLGLLLKRTFDQNKSGRINVSDVEHLVSELQARSNISTATIGMNEPTPPGEDSLKYVR